MKWSEAVHPRGPGGLFKSKGDRQRNHAQRARAKSAKRLERRNYEYHDLRSTQNQFLPEQARETVDRSYPEHKGKPFGPKPKDIPHPTFRPSKAHAAQIRAEERELGGFNPPAGRPARKPAKKSTAKKSPAKKKK